MPEYVRDIISDHLWYMKIFSNMQHDRDANSVRDSHTLEIIEELIIPLFSEESIQDQQVPGGTTAEQIFGDTYMQHIKPVYDFVQHHTTKTKTEHIEKLESKIPNLQAQHAQATYMFSTSGYAEELNESLAELKAIEGNDTNVLFRIYTEGCKVRLCGRHTPHNTGDVSVMNESIYAPGETRKIGANISSHRELKPFIEPTPRQFCFCFCNRLEHDPRIQQTVERLGLLLQESSSSADSSADAGAGSGADDDDPANDSTGAGHKTPLLKRGR